MMTNPENQTQISAQLALTITLLFLLLAAVVLLADLIGAINVVG